MRYINDLLHTQASANTVRLGLISGTEDMTTVGVQVYWSSIHLIRANWQPINSFAICIHLFVCCVYISFFLILSLSYSKYICQVPLQSGILWMLCPNSSNDIVRPEITLIVLYKVIFWAKGICMDQSLCEMLFKT